MLSYLELSPVSVVVSVCATAVAPYLRPSLPGGHSWVCSGVRFGVRWVGLSITRVGVVLVKKSVVAASVVGLVVVTSGYVAADVVDVVPGVLTNEPAPPTPAPFPSVDSAVLGGAGPAAAGASSGAVSGSTVAQKLNSVLSPGGEAGGLGPSYSVYVVDKATGEAVFDASGNQAKAPASVTKIVTVAAALLSLGEDFQSVTRVTTGATDNEVVLRGGGDVLLSAGTGKPGAGSGYAGMADLAAQVAESLRGLGITSISVTLDDSAFAGPTMAPDWEQADINNGFVAQVSSVAVDAGRVKPGKYSKRHADPGLAAAADFATAMKKLGFTVTGAPQRGQGPGEATVLGEVKSAPLSEVAGYILRTSDNVAAEALGRHVAMKRGGDTSFEGSARAVLDTLKDAGFDTSPVRLMDCSGLSKGSALTSSLVAGLLAKAGGDDAGPLRPLLTGLPVAGLEGTLASRFTRHPVAYGLTKAKTGTLSGVTALAGTVQSVDGNVLYFSILADQVPSTGGGRAASDAIVAALAECGCGG